ncbi:TPA: type III-A CRISPR-associated protein Csm6 [Streptococcus suis]|nr:type III-A CRISPR-associated protein Csm6 [Streptococcus suis]
MKVLISSVGNSDPIRGQHDGPLLHLARILRPEKIILIYSETLVQRHERIQTALLSIADYQPIIEVSPDLLPSSEIAIFDKMFARMSAIVDKCVKELEDDSQIFLNLSSGTAQIISSLFALNRIKSTNFAAYQVLSPNYGSNEKTSFTNDVPIEELIATNRDNVPSPENRTRPDQAVKFQESLGKRQVLQHIQSFDFQAAYAMMLQKQTRNWFSKTVRSKINRILENYDQAIKFQMPLDLPYDSELNKILTSYLLIDLSIRRELITDVLIKSKSLAEYMLESYIEQKYPGLVVKLNGFPKVNHNHPLAKEVNDYIAEQMRLDLKEKYDPNRPYNTQTTLNIVSFKNIIDCLEPGNDITPLVSTIIAKNGLRNKLAHGLEPINSKELSKSQLKQIGSSLAAMLNHIYPIDHHDFDYHVNNVKKLQALVNS